jgi:anti-sigma B factor antagonist
MRLNTREIGDVVVLDLDGKIAGGADYEVFVPALRSLVQSGHRKVVVNLEGVSWINSTGLGILIAGFAEMQRSGGVLKLAKVSPRIESLLAVTKLGNVFESYGQEDDAVRSFV